MLRQRGRQSSHKYSGDICSTESGSIFRAGCSKGHCLELGQENKTGKVLVSFCQTSDVSELLLQALASEANAICPLADARSGYPNPGLGALIPFSDSVLNRSHQNRWELSKSPGHGKPVKEVDKIEILRACSSFL